MVDAYYMIAVSGIPMRSNEVTKMRYNLDTPQQDFLIEFADAELEADRNYQSTIELVETVEEAIAFLSDNGHDWRAMIAYPQFAN